MTTTYNIAEADLANSSASIESLWVANLKGHSPATARDKLRLGYLDNPAGSGTAVLLFSNSDGTARGVQGLHPRFFHFAGRRLHAAGLADYAVDAAHRSLGPALMLMRRGTQLGAERFELTYGLPNAKAAPVLARAGLKRLGVMRRYAKPLAMQGRLSKTLPAWAAAGLAPFADRALHLADRLKSAKRSARLTCRHTSWHDTALDALWAQRPSALLLSERTGEMLRWRYGCAERGEWSVCLGFDARGHACGYVVWRLTGGFVEIGDFFTPDPARTTSALMLAFAELARRRGASSMSVEFFGCPDVARQLERAGLQVRPEQWPVFKGAGSDAELDAPERWYLTGFDNDAT